MCQWENCEYIILSANRPVAVALFWMYLMVRVCAECERGIVYTRTRICVNTDVPAPNVIRFYIDSFRRPSLINIILQYYCTECRRFRRGRTHIHINTHAFAYVWKHWQPHEHPLNIFHDKNNGCGGAAIVDLLNYTSVWLRSAEALDGGEFHFAWKNVINRMNFYWLQSNLRICLSIVHIISGLIRIISANENFSLLIARFTYNYGIQADVLQLSVLCLLLVMA